MFNGPNGSIPQGGVTLDGQANLYGITGVGGADGVGTVFEVARGMGTVTTLANFDGANGAGPLGGVALDGQGNLYGTTEGGGADGNGTVFEVARGTGTVTTLATFDGSNGALPFGDVALDGQGNLYGTTAGGGNGYGTVFEVARGTGTVTTLATFGYSNGSGPLGDIALDGQGNLYGTTEGGGADAVGTVFEVARGAGTVTTLATFDGSNGAYPYGGVALDGQGNLYGTTEEGRADGDGTVFEVARGAGTVTTLATFDGPNGAYPHGGVALDGQGNLYGTTEEGRADGDGTVFEVARGAGTVTTLATFDGSNGEIPQGDVELDGQGNLYGTTGAGGANGDGTVFEIPSTSIASIKATSPMLTAGGTIDYGYTISDNDLAQDTTVDLDWASGTTADTVIGSPIVAKNSQTAVGTYSLDATQTQLGTPPKGAKDLLVIVDPGDQVSPADPSKVAALPISDIAATSLAYDSASGGVDFAYSISGNELPEATTAELYWSSDPTFDASKDTLAYTTTTATSPGTTSVLVKPSQLLAEPPEGTKYLLGVVDASGKVSDVDIEDNVQSLALSNPGVSFPVNFTSASASLPPISKTYLKILAGPIAADLSFSVQLDTYTANFTEQSSTDHSPEALYQATGSTSTKPRNIEVTGVDPASKIPVSVDDIGINTTVTVTLFSSAPPEAPPANEVCTQETGAKDRWLIDPYTPGDLVLHWYTPGFTLASADGLGIAGLNYNTTGPLEEWLDLSECSHRLKAGASI